MFFLSLLGCIACEAAAPSGSFPAMSLPADFWPLWGDGNAEVSSFDLKQPRYGHHYDGVATLIFVTEDFSWTERVKADPGVHPDSDVRKVLKLNALRNFQTGIYPYQVMTSAFVRLDAGDGMAMLDPLKITFSAQEWCGMVFDELLPGPGHVRISPFTYFDGDGRSAERKSVPRDVVYGDTLPIRLRQLAGEWLAPGASVTAPYFPTQMEQRFAHVPPTVGTLVVTRGKAAEDHVVPAGTFSVEVWETTASAISETTKPVTTRWFLEAAVPHRIVGWSTSEGEEAALRGVDRLPYWALHDPGGEAARVKVGLPPSQGPG